MYWLRKFYGPTVLFSPETGAGAEPDPDADADADEADADADPDADDADEADADPDADADADEADADADPDADDAGASSASRRESRNARQARENRELREKLARIEGERDALKRPASPAEADAARRTREEKLALMSPEERMAFEAKEEVAGLRNEARTTQFMLLDMQDKNGYDILCTQDPIAAKHKAEVEKLLGEMRKNNTNAPRETLLDYIIGKHARMAAQSRNGKKKIEERKGQAKARVDQAKSKPMSARGDSGASGKGAETVEQMRERLLERERRGDVN